MISTAPKNLYLHKLLVPKGFSFCDKRRLNLQAFVGDGILLGVSGVSSRPGKLLCGLKTLLIFEILLSKHSLS